jgi:hypothetical protein
VNYLLVFCLNYVALTCNYFCQVREAIRVRQAHDNVSALLIRFKQRTSPQGFLLLSFLVLRVAAHLLPRVNFMIWDIGGSGRGVERLLEVEGGVHALFQA